MSVGGVQNWESGGQVARRSERSDGEEGASGRGGTNGGSEAGEGVYILSGRREGRQCEISLARRGC